MTAPIGNDYALKLPTPEDRKQFCAIYIGHLKTGLSDECFPECDPSTFKRYVREFPDDFDTDKIEVARRKRQLFWERAGRDGTMGEIKGFNAGYRATNWIARGGRGAAMNGPKAILKHSVHGVFGPNSSP